MKIIDGKAVAEEMKNSMKQEVLEYQKSTGRVPHLAAILVGNNPASKAYVGNKVRSCDQRGGTNMPGCPLAAVRICASGCTLPICRSRS